MDRVIIAASTHWDREWYRTFQDFQIRLCDLINNLLVILENDDKFKCYTFDGQIYLYHARQIDKRISEVAFEQIAKNVNTTILEANQEAIVIFN